MSDMTESLDPCPFCGGPGRADDDALDQNTFIPEYRWIACANCGARGPAVHVSSDDTAEAAWNRRA
jgi:Lar family restriction alleviation protein